MDFAGFQALRKQAYSNRLGRRPKSPIRLAIENMSEKQVLEFPVASLKSIRATLGQVSRPLGRSYQTVVDNDVVYVAYVGPRAEDDEETN